MPEWYIVFSSEEWRDHLASARPSSFPFFSSISQFRGLYFDVIGSTKGKYPFNWNYHIMNAVIGVSFTGEYIAKGLYEKTFGAFWEWFGGKSETAEDKFNRRWSTDYVDFIYLKPWYEFSFTKQLGELWRLPAEAGASWFRRWERRFFLSGEFLAKALWGWVIGVAAGSTFGAEDETMWVWLKAPADERWKKTEGVLQIESLGGEHYLVKTPRYAPFTKLVPALAAAKVRFVEIAGNRNLAATFVLPSGVELAAGELVSRWPVLTRTGFVREARLLEVGRLAEVMAGLSAIGVKLDHIFDY